MSRGASHPNIAKLIRQIEHIDACYANDMFYDAWKHMIVLLRGLKPKTKTSGDYKSLMKGLDYSVKRLDTIKSRNFPDAQIKRIILARQIDRGFQNRFMNILWTAKMLSDGGYSFFNPAGDKDSDSVVIVKGDRDTSRIR